MGFIVGITGQARAGKDTCAEYLAKKHCFVRIGLADPMKRFCKEVFNFSDDQLYGERKEEPDGRYFRGLVDPSTLRGNYLTPRYALQKLGTEWGRDCYPNVWIDYGLHVAKELLKGYSTYDVKTGLVFTEKDTGICPGVVFSDLRFLNEFLAVKAAGGIMCRVKRPSLNEHRVGIEGHASEEEQKRIPDSDFDIILDNNEEGNLDFLYQQIEKKLMDSTFVVR